MPQLLQLILASRQIASLSHSHFLNNNAPSRDCLDMLTLLCNAGMLLGMSLYLGSSANASVAISVSSSANVWLYTTQQWATNAAGSIWNLLAINGSYIASTPAPVKPVVVCLAAAACMREHLHVM